jgi:hypothetical protein
MPAATAVLTHPNELWAIDDCVTPPFRVDVDAGHTIVISKTTPGRLGIELTGFPVETHLSVPMPVFQTYSPMVFGILWNASGILVMINAMPVFTSDGWQPDK